MEKQSQEKKLWAQGEEVNKKCNIRDKIKYPEVKIINNLFLNSLECILEWAHIIRQLA